MQFVEVNVVASFVMTDRGFKNKSKLQKVYKKTPP
jgi:hypothetical protein